MQRLPVLLFSLFCTIAQGCTFGFERCDVIIGSGNYDYLGVQALNTGPFLSDTDDFFDGKPSTVVRMNWNTGAQTTSVITGIEYELTTKGNDTAEAVQFGVFGLLNTSLPVGLKVQLRENIVGGTLIAEGTMQPDESGTSTSLWLVFSNRSSGANFTVIEMYNDVGGVTGMSSGEEFTIGEIFAGYRSEWGIKRTVKQSWSTGPKIRLSSAGVQWPVLNPPVRTLSVELSPVTQKEAFSVSAPAFDVQTLVNNIQSAQVVAVMPFDSVDPSYYAPVQGFGTPLASLMIRAKTAWLGQLTAPPVIAADGDMYYDVQMAFQESV